MDRPFVARYGSWALVTGAASGLGAAFTRALAARGCHVVLLDLLADRAEALAREVAAAHGVQARVLVADLADAGLVARVAEATSGLEVGLLVNNANHVTIGPFLASDVRELERTVTVNCVAALRLTHHFGRAMAARGRGGVVLVSSLSALQGTRTVANYAASKAYDLVLAEGLHAELAAHGVDALGFCPGALDTEGFRASEPDPRVLRRVPVQSPERAVEEALAALGRTPSRVSGGLNRAVSFVTTRLLPRRWAIRVVGDNTAALYGHPGRNAAR